MPRKSISAFVVEVTIIVVLISIVGHLTVNFWERYFVTSELTHMKNSLHALKNTLYNIGNAYDALHVDMKTLTEESKKLKSEAECLKCKNTLDRRRLHDIKVNAIIDANKLYNANNPMRANYHFSSKIGAHDESSFPHHKDNVSLIAETNKERYKETKHNYISTDPIEATECGTVLTRSVAIETADKDRSNIATMTRYPLKNSAAGVSSNELHKQKHRV